MSNVNADRGFSDLGMIVDNNKLNKLDCKIDNFIRIVDIISCLRNHQVVSHFPSAPHIQHKKF